mgnify:CR=1 FL=1
MADDNINTPAEDNSDSLPKIPAVSDHEKELGAMVNLVPSSCLFYTFSSVYFSLISANPCITVCDVY